MVARNDRSRASRILGLALLAAGCLYLPTLFQPFFADDGIYLAFTNRFLREAPWSELHKLLLVPANPWEFLPLRDLTYWLDFRLFGDEPMGFHLSNLIWYVLSCAACFAFLREALGASVHLPQDRSCFLAGVGTLIFAVHPAHVEAVAWVASRKDLIAGAMSLWCFALALRAQNRGWPLFPALAAMLVFVAACFGKASAISGVFVIAGISLIGWQEASASVRRRRICVVMTFCALTAGIAAIHLAVGNETGVRIVNEPGLPAVFERASRILVGLTGIVINPYPPSFYHDVYRFSSWHWAVSAGILLLVVLALWALFSRRAAWPLGIILVVAPFVTYLQFVPFSTWSLASERFVFQSVAGAALVVISLVSRLESRRKVVAASVTVILVVLSGAVVVWERVGDWESRMALMAREWALHPSFHNVIRDEIAFRLLAEGQHDQASDLANLIPRRYAANALDSLVKTDRAFRAYRQASIRKDPSEEAGRAEFCHAVAGMRSTLRAGFEEIRTEPDLSYNNLLRTVEQALKYAFADERRLCTP